MEFSCWHKLDVSFSCFSKNDRTRATPSQVQLFHTKCKSEVIFAVLRNTSSLSGFKSDDAHITSLLQLEKRSFISFSTTSVALGNNRLKSAFSFGSCWPCISRTKSVSWLLAARFQFELLLHLAHCEQQIFHNVKKYSSSRISFTQLRALSSKSNAVDHSIASLCKNFCVPQRRCEFWEDLQQSVFSQ